jgi:hypothetical protein
VSVNNYEAEYAAGDGFERSKELLEKVREVLGYEAARRVFNATEKMSPQLRSIAYSGLEKYINADGSHVDEASVDSNHGNVVDIVTRVPLRESTDTQPAVTEIGLPDISTSTIENKIPLVNLMHRQLRNIFDEMPATLTVDDAGVVVETIQELRGRVLGRKKNVDSHARLHALVCGMPLIQVGLRENPPVTESPISNWVKLYCTKLKDQETYSSEYASELLRKRLEESKLTDKLY